MVAMQQGGLTDLQRPDQDNVWSCENMETSPTRPSQEGIIPTCNFEASNSSRDFHQSRLVCINSDRNGEELDPSYKNVQDSEGPSAIINEITSAEKCICTESSLSSQNPSESAIEADPSVLTVKGNYSSKIDHARIQEAAISPGNSHVLPSISASAVEGVLNVLPSEPAILADSGADMDHDIQKSGVRLSGRCEGSVSNSLQSEEHVSSSPKTDINGEIDDIDVNHRTEVELEEFFKEYPKRRRSSVGSTPVVPAPKKKIPSWCVSCERPIGDDYDQHLDEPGAVICKKIRCQRGFHVACLRKLGVSTIDMDTFFCPTCSENKVICIECQNVIDGDNLIRCAVAACGNRFHPACWKWGKNPCPVHACKKCTDRNVNCGSERYNLSHDRYSCVRCCTSYHVSCVPKSAVRLFLGLQTNKLVCERHKVLSNSIRWRPPLIIPLWVGVSTLKELSFSLSPEWLNGDVGNDEESVIIRPDFLGNSSLLLHNTSKTMPALERRFGVTETKTKKVKSKTLMKTHKLDNGMIQTKEIFSSFFDNFDFVPEFSLEPPSGFAMEPYKSRARNFYVVSRPLQSSREAAHICSCTPGMDCADDSCFNRSLQIECDARFCPCGELCRNQRLQKREWQPMRLVFTKDRGCGMMSQVPIKAGDLVIEYVGEVLDELSFRQRIQENTEKKRPQDNYYMMQLTRHLVIDARKTGNNARFLNHSCSPNCRTEIWEVAKGELRAGIFAMFDIPAGVELTYDYNFELFSKAVNSESVSCRCGASNCSKYLGIRPLRINSKK